MAHALIDKKRKLEPNPVQGVGREGGLCAGEKAAPNLRGGFEDTLRGVGRFRHPLYRSAFCSGFL